MLIVVQSMIFHLSYILKLMRGNTALRPFWLNWVLTLHFIPPLDVMQQDCATGSTQIAHGFQGVNMQSECSCPATVILLLLLLWQPGALGSPSLSQLLFSEPLLGARQYGGQGGRDVQEGFVLAMLCAIMGREARLHMQPGEEWSCTLQNGRSRLPVWWGIPGGLPLWYMARAACGSGVCGRHTSQQLDSSIIQSNFV